jgi:elongation factor G
MKVYQTNEIKNISLLGSSGSGKTTLVEAMLFESGVIKRRGSVRVQMILLAELLLHSM